MTEDILCNDNGSRLKQFCRSHKLCMIQTYFDVPLSERYTWFSNDGKTKRVLDYVLTENFVTKFITRCSIETRCKIESDHRLVVADLETPCTKRARWKKRIVKEKPRNLKELDRKEIKDLFIKELAKKTSIAKGYGSIEMESGNIVEVRSLQNQVIVPMKYGRTTMS